MIVSISAMLNQSTTLSKSFTFHCLYMHLKIKYDNISTVHIVLQGHGPIVSRRLCYLHDCNDKRFKYLKFPELAGNWLLLY